MHNETLAMTVAVAVLANPVIAIPAAVYSLLKFLIIPLFGRLVT